MLAGESLTHKFPDQPEFIGMCPPEDLSTFPASHHTTRDPRVR